MGYLKLRLSLLKNSKDTIWPIALGDKEIYIFLKGINLKGKIIEWLELELTHNNVTTEHISHYITRILSLYYFTWGAYIFTFIHSNLSLLLKE